METNCTHVEHIDHLKSYTPLCICGCTGTPFSDFETSTILVYTNLNGKGFLTGCGIHGYSHVKTVSSIAVCFYIKHFCLFLVFLFVFNVSLHHKSSGGEVNNSNTKLYVQIILSWATWHIWVQSTIATIHV